MAFPDEMKKGSSLDPRLNTDVPPGSSGGHEGGGSGEEDFYLSVRLMRITHQVLSRIHGRGVGDKSPNATSHQKTTRTFNS